jgi:E3 ubiquitin-protein ligase UNKL
MPSNQGKTNNTNSDSNNNNNNNNKMSSNSSTSSESSTISSSAASSTSSSSSSSTSSLSNQNQIGSTSLTTTNTKTPSTTKGNKTNQTTSPNTTASNIDSLSSPMVTSTQATEKPTHYTYLKSFRVEQCALFLQHKCTQHRPYTCFYWHFKNQRRRRPLRKRDGTFNYNPDVYCDKYDEQTGVCPQADECGFVHRNAGDTEKRYHLRYYKTATCIHETDAKGMCSKNGPHCAFAHGAADMRPPVYDIRELQQHHDFTTTTTTTPTTATPSGQTILNKNFKDNLTINGNNNDQNGVDLSQVSPSMNEKTINLSNNLEKERLLNEDPKWNETSYVLINYKTEHCRRPPRLCRQGFACPQYHNARDKRRNPNIYKYRSTPCPNVKQGDDWLEPTVCENGDNCKYCHSRTEQQFHPEVKFCSFY